MFGSKQHTVRSCRLSSTFQARRATRSIPCSSGSCCSRYEKRAEVELGLSISYLIATHLLSGSAELFVIAFGRKPQLRDISGSLRWYRSFRFRSHSLLLVLLFYASCAHFR